MCIHAVLSAIPSFPKELRLDLTKPEDRFKWFLASLLFAKRISTDIAEKTYLRFEEEGLTSPERILAAGWDRLVQVLDSGGYVRYDFSTASNLLPIMGKLRDEYGDLEKLHLEASDSLDLEKRLMEFKGIGPVCVNIFLRELRGIWEKARPKPSRLAVEAAQQIGLKDVESHESSLVMLVLRYCKKRRCTDCPFRDLCNKKKERS